jgi:hypothetical protein
MAARTPAPKGVGAADRTLAPLDTKLCEAAAIGGLTLEGGWMMACLSRSGLSHDLNGRNLFLIVHDGLRCPEAFAEGPIIE